jgi:hypothetical protein
VAVARTSLQLVVALIILLDAGRLALAQESRNFDFDFLLEQQSSVTPMSRAGNANEAQPVYFVDRIFSANGQSGGSDLPVVVGGAPAYSLPETVRILVRGRTYCSGVLLDWTTVLTAGHCACLPASSYQIQISAYEGNGRPRIFRGPVEREPTLFPGFSCALVSRKQPGVDLALLKIDIDNSFLDDRDRRVAHADLEFDWSLEPPGLAPITRPYLDPQSLTLLVVGYGRTQSGSIATDRMMARINVMSYFCSSAEMRNAGCAQFREFVLSNVLLTGRPAADTCSGDSGGPVFYFHGQAPNVSRLLVGITSRGLPGAVTLANLPCGGGGVYTAIGRPDVLGWLDEMNVDYRYESSSS